MIPEWYHHVKSEIIEASEGQSADCPGRLADRSDIKSELYKFLIFVSVVSLFICTLKMLITLVKGVHTEKTHK